MRKKLGFVRWEGKRVKSHLAELRVRSLSTPAQPQLKNIVSSAKNIDRLKDLSYPTQSKLLQN